MTDLIKALEGTDRGFPPINAGDTVRVHVRIIEGNRERIQVFQGTVIRKRKGGQDENFTVRRTASHGIGGERTFLLRSPRIEKVEVVFNIVREKMRERLSGRAEDRGESAERGPVRKRQARTNAEPPREEAATQPKG